MTKQPRPRREVEKIKKRILKKALDIVVESGPAALTMRRIAAMTGMSATNIYNYFANKEDIYLALLVRGYTTLYEKLEGVAGSTEKWGERLARELIGAYLSFGYKNPHYYDIMCSRPAPRYDDYVGTPLEERALQERELTRKIIALTQKAVEQLFKEKGLNSRGINPELAVTHIWCLLHGMVVLHNNRIIEYIAESPDTTYEGIIDFILRLIK